MRIASFLSCESGAITVDWTVLTAGLAGLGLAGMSVVSGGVQNLSEDISAFLQRDLSLFVRFDVNRISNASFEDIEGMLAAGWGFFNADGSLAGWTNVADYQAEVVHSGYMGVNATDGDFMLDLDASPGNMMLGQVIAGALDGQAYTVSFDAADRVGNNGVAVYWGGELVGTVDPGSGME